MEVILLEKIRNLGNLGDKVTVKNGHGRNFLIPYGHAVPATPENEAEFAQRRAELEKKAAERLAAAEARATKLASLTVNIPARTGDEGKLYGSIGLREIAIAVTKAGVELSKSEVQMPEGPIRNIGEYPINVQLHTDVQATVNVRIIEEN